MQDFQFLFVFIFFIILEIYPARFSSHKNCAPYWQLYLYKASYCALAFQFWVQKNLLRFNYLNFFRISYFPNFAHYFDWSSSCIVWVLLCFFIILHVVQFYYTFIIHMLLISLSSSPPLSALWVQGGASGWPGVCSGPIAMISLTVIALTASCTFQALGSCLHSHFAISVHYSSCSSDTYEGIAWLPTRLWFNSVFHNFITASGLHSILIRNHSMCYQPSLSIEDALWKLSNSHWRVCVELREQTLNVALHVYIANSI